MGQGIKVARAGMQARYRRRHRRDRGAGGRTGVELGGGCSAVAQRRAHRDESAEEGALDPRLFGRGYRAAASRGSQAEGAGQEEACTSQHVGGWLRRSMSWQKRVHDLQPAG